MSPLCTRLVRFLPGVSGGAWANPHARRGTRICDELSTHALRQPIAYALLVGAALPLHFSSAWRFPHLHRGLVAAVQRHQGESYALAMITTNPEAN
jgi:hypothetical protein